MPFLKNLWYVAANADELDADMVSRTICNEKIVMFRTSTGEVSALEDRCPHRFVPLSMGHRVDDTLQCGYHGLRFGADGSCVDMPNDPGADTRRACIRSYPAVLRYGVVWIWMGDKELADPATIPTFDFITDPNYACAQGYLHIKANYQLITDNLLDLSHVHYLHPAVDHGADFHTFENKVRAEGDMVWSMLWRPDLKFPDARLDFMGLPKGVTIDGQGHSRWTAPSLELVYTAWFERGKTAEDGVQSPSAHLVTPETEYSSHYFWAVGRTHQTQDAELTARTAEMVHKIFTTEDGPMIEAQQEAMGDNTDFLDHKPMILKADAAGVLARRMLKRRIKEERAGASAETVATAAE